MILLIILIVLLFGGVGPWYGYNRGYGPGPFGPGYGGALVPILLLIVLLMFLGHGFGGYGPYWRW